jgi:OmpA-OmpF porin, OOP family
MTRIWLVVIATAFSVWIALTPRSAAADVEVADPKDIAAGLLGQPISNSRAVKVEARPNSISLDIRFELNSAKLTLEAEPQLEALWNALTLAQLRGKQVEIAGHTDSIGSAAYNLRLSEQRAASVRDFLLAKGTLQPERLDAVGMGEIQPISGISAEDPMNRRVEVRLVPRRSE